VATFAEALPEILPNKALDNTATFAGPPLNLPANFKEKFINPFPPPLSTINAPNIINMTIIFTDIPTIIPQIPLVVRYNIPKIVLGVSWT